MVAKALPSPLTLTLLFSQETVGIFLEDVLNEMARANLTGRETRLASQGWNRP